MAEFHFDPKLYDTLDDEQKKLLNEAKEQITASNKKEFEVEYQARVEKEKQEALTRAQKEAEAKATRDKYLSSVPEKNKALVNRLLEAGETPETINSNYSQLLEPEPENVPGEFLADQINGVHDEAHTTPDGNVNAERDAEIKKWNEQGIDPNDKEANARFAEYKKQGLL